MKDLDDLLNELSEFEQDQMLKLAAIQYMKRKLDKLEEAIDEILEESCGPE